MDTLRSNVVRVTFVFTLYPLTDPLMLITAGISQQPPCPLQQWPHYHHNTHIPFKYTHTYGTAKATNTLMKQWMFCSSHRWLWRKNKSRSDSESFFHWKHRKSRGQIRCLNFRLPVFIYTWEKTGRRSCRALNRVRRRRYVKGRGRVRTWTKAKS